MMARQSNAERMRAQRQRQRDGLICVQLPIPHEETVEWLIARGLLDDADYYDRHKISKALERSGARIVLPS